ncbi:MAG: hypothetical protein EXS58_08465 [Candidatus Latescibacteria bacterium]|nr:hypothetical protein [Candidatus Latescibacterota bacterium]
MQVRHSPQRWSLLRWCLPLAGAGAVAIVVFNYAYSNDPFGPFLPGNTWDSEALKGSTLLLSLPGQWLHETTGLLNSSPVFLASLLGLALLATRRDRRGWGVLAFYLVTAGVNGLHPDRTFGFCPPARYLLTAMPVLLFGLALFVQAYGNRLLPLFGLLFALIVSYDSVACVVAMPEQGYGGNHLSVRTLDEYYPFDVHFFFQTTGALPRGDLAFWALATASLAAASLPRLSPSWRWSALLTAGLLPFAWGQTGAPTGRLSASVSPYLLQLNPAGQIPAGVQFFNRHIEKEYQMTTGHALKAGGFGAQSTQSPAGILKSYYAPLTQPGISSYWLLGAAAENAPGQAAGHLIVGQRQTLPAIADWGIFHASAIALPGKPASTVKTTFYSDFTGLGYVYVEFSGAGALAFTNAETRFLPIHFGARRTELRRFPGNPKADVPRFGVHCENLDKGYSLARFELQGTAAGTFFERKPSPVFLAVYTAENSPTGAPSLEAQASHWLDGYYSIQDPTPRPDFIRPMVESVQAPWWTAVPLVGASAYQLEFHLNLAQDIWLVFDYPGKTGLKLAGITLFSQELSAADLTD